MAKTPVIIATTVVAGLLILQVVGLATPHWMDIKGADVHFGVFQVCSSETCVNYIIFMGFTIHYLGFAAFQTIGSMLMLITAIIGLTGAVHSKRPVKNIVQTLAGLCFAAAFFIISSVAWFALSFFKTIGALYTMETLTMGYSFILATVSGVGVLIMAVSCCIISQNMSHPPVVAQTPGAQPMVVMATTNPPMMYPQAFGQVPGQPPPIYGHYVYTNPPHPGHYAYPVGEEQACHQPVRGGMQTTHAQGNEYGHPPVYNYQISACATGGYGPPPPDSILPSNKPPTE